MPRSDSLEGPIKDVPGLRERLTESYPPGPPTLHAKTLAVDLDGALHAYSRGWSGGALYDDPMPGAVEAMWTLSLKWRLVVFTARRDLQAVLRWLNTHGFPEMEVTNQKPPAWAYIDDRAIEFKSWQQTLERIASEVRKEP